MPAPVVSINAANPLQVVNKTPATKTRAQENFAQVLRQQEEQKTVDKTTDSAKNAKTNQPPKTNSRQPTNDAIRRDAVATTPADKPKQITENPSDAESAKLKPQEDLSGSVITEHAPASELGDLNLVPAQLVENTSLDVQEWLALNLQFAPASSGAPSSVLEMSGDQVDLILADDSVVFDDQFTALALTLRQMHPHTQAALPPDTELDGHTSSMSSKLLGLNSFDLSLKAQLITSSGSLDNNLQSPANASANSVSLGSLIPVIASKFASEVADVARPNPEQMLLAATTTSSENPVGLNSEGKGAAQTLGVQSLQASAATEAKTFLQLRFNQQTLAQDLVEKTGWLIEHKLDTAQIQLDPAELGPITVKIHSHQDQVSVSFVVNNQQVRDAMDQTLQRLKELLAEQGVMLAHADVNSQQHNHDGRAQGEGAGQHQDDADADIAQTIDIAEPQSGIDHFV